MTRRSLPPCLCRGLWPRRGVRAFFHSTGIDNTMNIHATMGIQVKVMCKWINCNSPEKNPPVNTLSLKRAALFPHMPIYSWNWTNRKTTEVTYRILIWKYRWVLCVFFSFTTAPLWVHLRSCERCAPKNVQINFSVSPTTVRQFSGHPTSRKINEKMHHICSLDMWNQIVSRARGSFSTLPWAMRCPRIAVDV